MELQHDHHHVPSSPQHRVHKRKLIHPDADDHQHLHRLQRLAQVQVVADTTGCLSGCSFKTHSTTATTATPQAAANHDNINQILSPASNPNHSKTKCKLSQIWPLFKSLPQDYGVLSASNRKMDKFNGGHTSSSRKINAFPGLIRSPSPLRSTQRKASPLQSHVAKSLYPLDIPVVIIDQSNIIMAGSQYFSNINDQSISQDDVSQHNIHAHDHHVVLEDASLCSAGENPDGETDSIPMGTVLSCMTVHPEKGNIKSNQQSPIHGPSSVEKLAMENLDEQRSLKNSTCREGPNYPKSTRKRSTSPRTRNLYSAVDREFKRLGISKKKQRDRFQQVTEDFDSAVNDQVRSEQENDRVQLEQEQAKNELKLAPESPGSILTFQVDESSHHFARELDIFKAADHQDELARVNLCSFCLEEECTCEGLLVSSDEFTTSCKLFDSASTVQQSNHVSNLAKATNDETNFSDQSNKLSACTTEKEKPVCYEVKSSSLYKLYDTQKDTSDPLSMEPSFFDLNTYGSATNSPLIDSFVNLSNALSITHFSSVIEKTEMSLQSFTSCLIKAKKKMLFRGSGNRPPKFAVIAGMLHPSMPNIRFASPDHFRYGLQACISETIFKNFESQSYGGEPTTICYGLHRQFAFLKDYYVLESLHNCAGEQLMEFNADFETFCHRKLEAMKRRIGWISRWPGKLLQAFLLCLKYVWTAHKLAFAFEKPAAVFFVKPKAQLDLNYMSPLIDQVPTTDSIQNSPSFYGIVQFSAFPGFALRRGVVHSTVYLKPKLPGITAGEHCNTHV